jgi:hypothetical protein
MNLLRVWWWVWWAAFLVLAARALLGKLVA